jgi:hypothetical protein
VVALDMCSVYGTGHEVIIPEIARFGLLLRLERARICPQIEVKRLTFWVLLFPHDIAWNIFSEVEFRSLLG